MSYIFTPRLTRPEKGNKYYIRKASGGYSPAVAGNPTDADCDVLSNCVGYAIGRFNEIGGYGECRYLPSTNAELFIQKNPKLTVSQTPALGAVIVWRKGDTYGQADGAGHVAIVEKIIDADTIVTSESGWATSTPFWTKTRKRGSDNNWGQASAYHFLGFILNPAVPADAVLADDTQTAPTGEFVHIVLPGESVSKIAMQYGLDWEELAAYNSLSNPNLIRPGMELRIPVPIDNFQLLDEVMIKSTCLSYANGKLIPSWVKAKTLYVRKINDDDTITISTVKEGAVTGTVRTQDLVKIVDEEEPISSPEVETPTVELPAEAAAQSTEREDVEAAPPVIDPPGAEIIAGPAPDDSVPTIEEETGITIVENAEPNSIDTSDEVQAFLTKLINIIVEFLVKLFGGKKE